jgi:hypothetical protein
VTTGSSATAAAVPIWSSSPGPTSSDTIWSREGRHLTTRPWPSTGPFGVVGQHPRHWKPRPAPAPGAAGHLSGVRGTAPLRRPSTAEPTRARAVGACHRQGIGQAPHDLPQRRLVGCWHPPPHPRPLRLHGPSWREHPEAHVGSRELVRRPT